MSDIAKHEEDAVIEAALARYGGAAAARIALENPVSGWLRRRVPSALVRSALIAAPAAALVSVLATQAGSDASWLASGVLGAAVLWPPLAVLFASENRAAAGRRDSADALQARAKRWRRALPLLAVFVIACVLAPFALQSLPYEGLWMLLERSAGSIPLAGGLLAVLVPLLHPVRPYPAYRRLPEALRTPRGGYDEDEWWDCNWSLSYSWLPEDD